MDHKFRKLIWSGLFLTTVCFSGCQLEIVIEQGTLDRWFWSRFGWAMVTSAVLGAVAAKLLCRLPIRAPLMDCIKTARMRFTKWMFLLVLLLTPLFLWFDALMTQPFGEGNELGALNIFFLVTLDWRMLGLMLCVAVVFYLTVGIFTRAIFGRTCNCKYAFIPKGSG
jgi:hypothetical protein